MDNKNYETHQISYRKNFSELGFTRIEQNRFSFPQGGYIKELGDDRFIIVKIEGSHWDVFYCTPSGMKKDRLEPLVLSKKSRESINKHNEEKYLTGKKSLEELFKRLELDIEEIH